MKPKMMDCSINHDDDRLNGYDTGWNAAVIRYEKFLPSEKEIQQILWEVARIEIGSPASVMLALAISKRLGGE